MSVEQHSADGSNDIKDENADKHFTNVGERKTTFSVTYTVNGSENTMSVPKISRNNCPTVGENVKRDLQLIEGSDDIEILSVTPIRSGSVKRPSI